MEWFTEIYNDVGLTIKIKKTIIDVKSNYQHIQLFDTFDFGKMLVLDGKIQLSERDEPFYHEMLVHVPMLTHRNPKKVLIIGGGDGGSLREVLKHDPSEVILVELDKMVLEISKKYLGIDKGAFSDSRVSVLFEDGFDFIMNCEDRFDVVIVDGTDPNPFSEHIISKEFYKACKKISDVFVTQSQSPFIQTDYFKRIYENIRSVMDVHVYINYVPLYPLGLWSYLIYSDNYPSEDEIEKRYQERNIKTIHYNPEIHIASFCLPNWLKSFVP